MFTGIIEAVGKVQTLRQQNQEWQLGIVSDTLDFSDVQLGDSIAVNGCCLTVTALPGQGFRADVSAETLRLTTLGKLAHGAVVNLEKALTPSKRLGGHIVSGHVDGVGELLSLQASGGSVIMHFRVPAALARYIAKKGSICIDGTSLTVNEVSGDIFSIYVIPHTQQETIMHTYRVAQAVNLEVDLISRYLERLLLGDAAADADASAAHSLTREFLSRHGYD